MQAAQAVDVAEWLPNDLLTKLDRCLMVHGVEGRTPFLDPAGRRFRVPACPTPTRPGCGSARSCCATGWRRRFPEAGAYARKKGFKPPVGAWIAARAGDAGAVASPAIRHRPGVRTATPCRPSFDAAADDSAAGLEPAVLRALAQPSRARPRPVRRYRRGARGGRDWRMRTDCERCHAALPMTSETAFICSFECTFCADCTHPWPDAAPIAAASCCGDRCGCRVRLETARLRAHYLQRKNVRETRPMKAVSLERPDASAALDVSAILSKAVARSAVLLGVSNAVIARVLGVSEATMSRLKSGTYVLERGSKPYELAQLFVRLFRSLNSITGGDDAASRSWLVTPNTALEARPLDLIQTIPGLFATLAYVDSRRAPL